MGMAVVVLVGGGEKVLRTDGNFIFSFIREVLNTKRPLWTA